MGVHLAGRSYLALIDADKAVALDPELRSALQTRSEIFKSLGRGEDAEADRAAAKALQEKAAAEAEKKSAEARDAASRIKAELVAAELAYFKTSSRNISISIRSTARSHPCKSPRTI